MDLALNKKVSQKDIALIISKELADLVVVLPGPYPIKSFLKKMLDSCKLENKDFSLVEMVDALDTIKQNKILEKYNCIDESPESTPILFSIKSAIEANKPDVWQHTVSNKIGIDINAAKNNVLDWAFLLYFECMLIKKYEM